MAKTEFVERARREDFQHGHMVVQRMLEFLRDKFDAFTEGVVRGSSTIIPPATTVIAIHNLGNAIYSVGLTPMADVGAGIRWWISNKTGSQFQINLSAAPAANVPFDWIVKGESS